MNRFAELLYLVGPCPGFPAHRHRGSLRDVGSHAQNKGRPVRLQGPRQMIRNIGRPLRGTGMRVSRITAVIVAVWIGVLGSAAAQVGHPVKGTWVGYWGQGTEN